MTSTSEYSTWTIAELNNAIAIAELNNEGTFTFTVNHVELESMRNERVSRLFG
jgi:hypothetical protein